MAKTVKIEIDADRGSLCVSDGALFLGEKAPIQFTGFTLDEGHSLRLTVFDCDRKTPVADNSDDSAVLDLRYECLRRAFHMERGIRWFYSVVNELDESGAFLEHVLAAGVLPIAWSPEVFDEVSGNPATMRGATGATGATGAALTWDDLTEEQKASLKGAKGDPGTPGAAGAQGPTGPEGPQGQQGAQGIQGQPGAKGDKGDKGDTGETGAQGPQGPQGQQGQQGPQGVQGIQGVAGAAATITVGSTVTLPAGSAALVENLGSTAAAELRFSIPKGAKGDKGDKGDKGETGEKGDSGTSASVTVASTTTISPGESARVENTGSATDVALAFYIPNGHPGLDGVSPSVRIVDITGGHRITITDKEHPLGQTFDVMDGRVEDAAKKPTTGSLSQDSSLNDVITKINTLISELKA